MIHKLFNLTRPLFIPDTETTGLNTKSDRIIELGFQQWTSEGMIKEWRSLIDPGVKIPPHLAKVHGITDATLLGCRECGELPIEHVMADHVFMPHFKFRDLARNLALGFTNCDFAGKNVRFDLQIIAAEMDRAEVEWDYSGARIIDADRLEQIAEPRTLSHLHEKYTGHPHDDAHTALSDVRASATVIVGQLERYPEALPRDLDQLHKMQWPGWITAGGEFRFAYGVPTCMFGKHRGTPMKGVPMSYYDWILTAKFPQDVMDLARAAKLGQFPEGEADGS